MLRCATETISFRPHHRFLTFRGRSRTRWAIRFSCAKTAS